MIIIDLITKSIILLIAGLTIFQVLFLYSIAAFFSLLNSISISGITTILVFHLILLFALLNNKNLFCFEPSLEKLKRINFSNFLTLFRLSSIPTMFFLIMMNNNESELSLILLVFMIISFITDFFDGLISRLTKQLTTIGKYLDSISDYSILFVISTAFFILKIIPLWLFVLLIIRALAFLFGLLIIFIKQGFLEYETSFLGKASIFIIMFLFAFETLVLVFPKPLNGLLVKDIVEYFSAFVLILSTFDKLLIIIKKMFKHSPAKTN